MSKAFTKEDVEIPERVGRKRSGGGLPPGAVNYMTEEGARMLREKLAKDKGASVAEIRRILDSVTVVPPRDEPITEVLFGATATIRTGDGELIAFRIVGADETALAPGWVSWVSAEGRALIGMRVGQRVRLPETGEVEIVEVR